MNAAGSDLDRLGPALLFCPGDRPDRFAKAVDRSDTVILDLEDAVAPAAKDSARAAVAEALPALPPGTIVRVNPVDTKAFAADLDTVRRAGATRVMLPKVEHPADLDGLEDLWVLALCESAKGVLHAEDIAAHPACRALMWGGEDLVADLGGRRTRDDSGAYYPVVHYARSRILLAAKAARILAVDSIYTDIADLEGLAAETAEAVDVGFDAKTCIHPSHVPVIRAAFAPSADRLDWARAVVELAARSNGVFTYEGRMVDEPLLRQARAVLAASTGTAAAGRRDAR